MLRLRLTTALRRLGPLMCAEITCHIRLGPSLVACLEASENCRRLVNSWRTAEGPPNLDCPGVFMFGPFYCPDPHIDIFSPHSDKERGCGSCFRDASALPKRMFPESRFMAPSQDPKRARAYDAFAGAMLIMESANREEYRVFKTAKQEGS